MNAVSKSHSDPKGAGTPFRVLIVEDDLCLKTVFSRILRSVRQDASLHWVTNAEDALRELRAGGFELIVVDYMLPGKASGLDLWRHCRREHAQTPFLMTSGLAVGDLLRVKGPATVRPRFLFKPFRVHECQAILEAIFREANLQRAA